MLSGSGHGSRIRIRHLAPVASLVVAAVPCGYALAAEAGALGAPLTDLRAVLLIGFIGGVIVFAAVAAAGFVRAARRAREAEACARASADKLEQERRHVDAILTAEPQILIHWDETETARVVAETLPDELGVPTEPSVLLCFDKWLERDSANEVTDRLAALRGEGAAFNVMSKTIAGTHVEIDGRAAGGGTVVKIRDLAGRREQLARVCEQHSQLGKDIAALRALLDALPAPVWLRDANGNIEWVNRSYVKAVDAAGPAQVYQDQIELLHARSRAAAEQRLDAGEAFRGSALTSGAGVERSVDAIVIPVDDGSAGIALDAPRLDAEQAELTHTLEAYARTLDRIATAVAVFSGDQRLIYSNQAYRELLDLPADWLDSKPRDGEVLDRLRAGRRIPEEADYREWKDKQLAIYSEEDTREDWWHLPDERTIHVVADRGADGGVTYFYEDVTERIALESRYNALARVQKETLDNLREGVAVFATDGRLKLFNLAFARIWKLDRGELAREPHIDTVITQCRVLLDDDAAWEEVQKAVTGIADQRRAIEGQLSRPDGSVLAYAGLPLPDGAMLLTYVDITDTKRVERALIERAEALETADQLKNTFISHISYELRVPLTNIIGFAELLSADITGALNPKQREYVGDIRSSSDTLLAIINDILDLATIDAGALELKLSRVRVADVVDAAVLGVRERLQRAKVALKVKISEGVSELTADGKRVTQVLYNLLSNAIGFSKEGGVVRLTCTRDGDMIALSVADEGVGIPKDYQQHAFNRFESRTQGSNHRGAGLGLSIVKSLVELHHGDITLESAPGEGTTVTVRLPVEQRARAGEEPRAAE